MENKQVIAMLGSSSANKLEALNSGLELAGIKAKTFAIDVDPRVPFQPEGEETRVGAMNRAAYVRGFCLRDFVAVGIENGIRQEGKATMDFAVVCMITPDGRTFMAESEAVTLPSDAVAEARRRGFDETTVGQVMAELYGSVPDDPHSYVTSGRATRWQIIALAVKRVFERVMGDAGTAKPDFLHVNFQRVDRFLPVRKVSPGLSVALFNPLGDWALIEDVGKCLATKIPSGTDVLLMPDGKAQALLHVMGRESRLTTVVARKELKPYMAAPALEAEVKSVTTVKVQQLFLGADDAARLRGKRVVIVDDVVSSGGTLNAVRELLTKAGAIENGVMAVFTEGGSRSDVIALGDLPLFKS